MLNNIDADIAAVKNIAAVATILEVLCQTTGMGFAAVARVTEDKWVACDVRDDINFGLKPGGELKVETTICHEIRQHREPVVIDNVANDRAYCDHHTPALYGIQSYISVPIILANDSFFGTLCAIDPNPANLNNPKTIGMFKLFAELIAFHLNAAERLAMSESSLLEERQASQLREQFIAVLSHDLRNPLNAVTSGAEILLRMDLSERAAGMANMIKGCGARMSELIENVLDFARGRLGSGVALQRTNEPLEPVLRHIIDELHTAWPQRDIETDFAVSGPVNADGKRIGQLFSNILGNALSYGDPGLPVRVRAAKEGGTFVLSVANGGAKIPAAAMQRLFQPFSRGEVQSDKQGLGLGLYIASEIAKAHGGTLDAHSTEQETKFTFRMPV